MHSLEQIRSRLESLFGIELELSRQAFEGRNFDVIRPKDLEKGIGFAVSATTTPRRAESAFILDSYARALARRMCDADAGARRAFDDYRKGIEVEGANVTVFVDGEVVSSLERQVQGGERIEIEVARRLVHSNSPDEHLFKAAQDCFALALYLLPTEELAAPLEGLEDGFPEGGRMQVTVNRYERSPSNRAACLRFHGYVCKGCGFDFRLFYGEIAAGHIHVHHKTPVSKMGSSYSINPIEDLIPLCANCHSVVHLTDPPMEVEALRNRLLERGAGYFPAA